MFELVPSFDRDFDRSLYRPFDDLDNLEREFLGSSPLAAFKTDIQDKGDNYELTTDLPGFKKEDIHLSLNGDTLSIQAERHSDWEKDESKKQYVRCERSYGKYTRSFDVTGIDTDHIQASYTDGVLTLNLPKRMTCDGGRRIEIM